MLVSLFSVSEERFDPAVKQYHESLTSAEAGTDGKDLLVLDKRITQRYVKAGETPPTLDSNLSGVSRRLCRVFDLDAADGALTSRSQLIQFSLRQFGVTDSFYFPVLAPADTQAEANRWVDLLVGKNVLDMGFNRFGAYWSKEDKTVAMVFSRRLVQLSPFPMSVKPGTAHLLFGSLLGASRNPQLLISTPDGAFLQQTPKVSGDLFWIQVYLPEEPGEYMLEVLVEEEGPQVASLFPVYVGSDVPLRPVTRLFPGLNEDASVLELEKSLLGLINRARRHRGLTEVRLDPTLSVSARKHSEEMARQRRLVHAVAVPGESGGGNFRENVSISTSIATTHANLLASPSHRRNIMNSESRRCGVGIVARNLEDGTRILFVTERFSD